MADERSRRQAGADRAPWDPLAFDHRELSQAVASARARHEVAGLRLGSWAVARSRLVLRLTVVPGRAEGSCPPPTTEPRHHHLAVGAGLVAVPVLLLDSGLTAVSQALVAAWGRSGEEILATARATTRAQPLHRLTTNVTAGPDLGSRISVLTGQPLPSGLVVDLDRFLDLDDPPELDHRADLAPALVVVAPDGAVVAGQSPDPDDRGATRALAHRLLTLAAGRGPVLRFHQPGRLSIFDGEDHHR